jgi:hypothetical protein
MEMSSPSPTTVVNRRREKRQPHRPPPAEKPPRDRGLQIEAAESGSSGAPPYPPPRRAREGSTGSRNRGLHPDLTGLFRELRPAPALTATRHGRRRGGELAGHQRRPTTPTIISARANRRTQKLPLTYELYRGAGRPSPSHSGRRGRRRRGGEAPARRLELPRVA